MSASSHDAPTQQSGHGDHAHAHAFDGEPVQVLPPDEPRTPGWVPLLGVLLFVLGGVVILLSGDDDAASGTAPEKTTAETTRPQAAAPPAPQPPAPPGAAPTAPAVQRLSPEQAKLLQQRLDDARARQAAQPGGQPPAPGAQPGQVPPSRPILRPVPTAQIPPPAPGGGAQ